MKKILLGIISIIIVVLLIVLIAHKVEKAHAPEATQAPQQQAQAQTVAPTVKPVESGLQTPTTKQLETLQQIQNIQHQTTQETPSTTTTTKHHWQSPLACSISTEIPSVIGKANNLNPQVLKLAMKAYSCALKSGYQDPRGIISIIDYSLPSTEKRLWVIDLKHNQVLYNTLVAQGKNTGGLFARYFSDNPKSLQSSLGLFITQEPYIGHDGYSLRINGLEPGFNDKAEDRDIVIHGAWYVSEDFIRRTGRLGESWGCPAVPKDVITPLINTVKGGTFLFSYYPNPAWLANSKFLHCK